MTTLPIHAYGPGRDAAPAKPAVRQAPRFTRADKLAGLAIAVATAVGSVTGAKAVMEARVGEHERRLQAIESGKADQKVDQLAIVVRELANQQAQTNRQVQDVAAAARADHDMLVRLVTLAEERERRSSARP